MKQSEFRRQLTASTPDMPEHFVRRVDRVLEGIAAQDENAPTCMGRSIRKRTIVIIVALIILLMSLTASALMQWKSFEQLSDIVGDHVSEAADGLMQSDLHQQTINGVEITLREAGYDGRTLLLQYSYRFPDMDEPLGVTADAHYQGHVPEGIHPDSIVGMRYDALTLMQAYGVDWWTDEFWINGEPVPMPGGSGSVDVGSHVPGELIHTEYWRLDNESVKLDGIAEITLPIGRQEAGGFTFTFDTRGIQSQIVTSREAYHAEFDSFSATITEATFTPLMTYITMAYEDTHAAQVHAADGSWWPFGTGNACLAWIYSLQLVDQQGEPVFSGSYSADRVSETEAQFYLPYVPASYDGLWLAPVYDGRADMTQAIRVR